MVADEKSWFRALQPTRVHPNRFHNTFLTCSEFPKVVESSLLITIIRFQKN